MKILHPEHFTAWSTRTTGFPLVFYDSGGREVCETTSTKKRVYFDVPDTARFAILFYRTNSGHRVLKPYVFPEGVLTVWWKGEGATPELDEVIERTLASLKEELTEVIPCSPRT